jgi:hypothetical protein
VVTLVDGTAVEQAVDSTTLDQISIERIVSIATDCPR